MAHQHALARRLSRTSRTPARLRPCPTQNSPPSATRVHKATPAYRCPRVNYTDGVFRCACCGQPLFYATTKFQPAGDGWPAFHGNASIPASNYNGSAACSPGGTEVVCSKCGSHLGDYFPSGTIEPFEYYCIDGVCLLPPGAAEGEVCEPSVAVPPPSKVEAYKALRGLMREKGARATVAIMSAHGD